MLHSRKRDPGVKALALVAISLVLGACSGEESDVSEQVTPARIEATGLVTDGVQVRAHSIAGKGAVGTARLTRTSASGEYTLNLSELSAPYLFSNTLNPETNPDIVVLTTLATRSGVANLTPLTTLLTAQLLGMTPANAIASFNDTASVDTSRITDAAIQAAQADLTRFLQEVYGVQMKSGTASFIDTPFTATTGDAMYDTIQSLNARLAQKGSTLAELSGQIASAVRACMSEEIGIVVNGAQKEFCPVLKSALPREADTTIIDYTFRTVWNESITLSARQANVLSASYTDVEGVTFTCEGADCGSISLGEPAEDLTRALAFVNATFTGPAGSAMANGSLQSAVPGITIPPLPCVNNRFYAIYEDRSVLGDCSTTNHPFNLVGSFGAPVGPGQEWYLFINSNTPAPELPRLEVVLDYGTAVPTVVSVFYQDNDPATQTLRNRFVCQGEACNGVTVGPLTLNMSLGFPVDVVPLNLQDTVLTGIDENGVATGETVLVRASLVALRLQGQDVSYPPPGDCSPEVDAIAAEAAGAAFNLCVPESTRSVSDVGNADVQISLTSEAGEQISLTLRNDVLIEAVVSLWNVLEQYRCATDCSGITVSPPDASGVRNVTFSEATLRRIESFPRPGLRTLTLSSGTLEIPPP